MRHLRELVRIEKRSRRQFETANDRFQGGYNSTTALCILIATGAHLGLFATNPRLQVADLDTHGDDIVAMTLPPDVRIPPPPETIVRPARPRVSDAPVAREITIAPTTFEANPTENLPPVPPVAKRQGKDREPFYVPRDIEPRLLNGSEVAELLHRNYPKALCEAGIQGQVLLWIYVDQQGCAASCRVHTSSGYPMLDAAAQEVVGQMHFAPALHMDQPVAVWIAQPIEFRIS